MKHSNTISCPVSLHNEGVYVKLNEEGGWSNSHKGKQHSLKPRKLTVVEVKITHLCCNLYSSVGLVSPFKLLHGEKEFLHLLHENIALTP